MPRRYLFLCPDRRTPSGGIAVIYDTVAALNALGYEAAVVHGDPRGGYADPPARVPLFHSFALREVWQRHHRGKHWLKQQIALWRARLRGGPLPALVLRPDDVIVTPEVMMAEAMEAFPDTPLGVFVQNPFSFMNTHLRGLDRGFDIRKRASWMIGIAGICLTQFRLLDFERVFYLPVSMKPEEFPFRADKAPLITYMPRKRPKDAAQIDRILRERGRIAGYDLVALDRLPRAEVSRRLQDSLVFISLLKTEALGFPAAEAMAAGCITIGFTGLGTEEYFTPETGLPVPEGDTAALIHAVEAAVAEYEADPARLDALRRHASELVNARYSTRAFETTLAQIWPQIDAL